MIALLQRVSEASVRVNDGKEERTTGAIGKGLLVLLGVERGDTTVQADRLLERIIAYRIFPDADDRMNLNVKQAQGELLVVSQFTLAADTRKGNRPGFSGAADPDTGNALYEHLVQGARQRLGFCAAGEFGADMQVHLVNDGPVTFQLRVAPEAKSP